MIFDMNKDEIKKKYESLKESLGINNDVTEWSLFLYDIILNQILLFSKDLDNEENKEKVKLILDNDEISYGAIYNFPIEYFNKLIDENIKDNRIKLKDIELNLEITYIPEDMFSTDLFSANYNDNDIKYENGIIYNILLNIDIYLPIKYLDIEEKNLNTLNIFLHKYGISTYIKSMLNHEMTHVLDFTERFKKGKNSEELILNYLINILKKNKMNDLSPLWEYFLNLIYLQLSFEANARVSQLNSIIGDKKYNNQEDFWSAVEKTSVWKEMSDLSNFDAKIFYDNFTYDANDDDINQLFEYEGTEKDKVFKYFINLFNDIIDDVNEFFKNEYNSNKELKKLPKQQLDNPLVFLEYWEKRFHKVFDKFKKKVSRLYTNLK